MLTDSKQTRGASTVRQLRHTDAKTLLTLLNLVTFLRLLAFKKLFLPRDAMHPRYYSHGPVSVRPSQAGVLGPTKTAKHRITQTTPHDTPGTL